MKPVNITIIILSIILLAAPLHAAEQTEQTKQVVSKSPEAKKQTRRVSTLVDNDVYLFTQPMWDAMERFQDGGIFDLDAELDRIIEKQPHVFSAYFWSGMIKIRRQMIAPGQKKYGKDIERLFSTCSKKARKAQQLKKYKKAGLFYEATSEAGLAMFHGIRGSYLKAHGHARKAMRQFDKVRKIAPNLHGMLLVDGLYNFYTGRFGAFTKFLMRLVGIPTGDHLKGLKQIRKASATDSPFHYFANLYAVYAFTPVRQLRSLALKKANALIKRYPKNYYGYLLRGFVYEKMSRYPKALKSNLQGRALLPGLPSDYKDIIYVADMFLLDVRSSYQKAMLQQDVKSLNFLMRWSNNRAAEYEDAPVVATMFLGHLFSQAELDEKAMDFYEKMQSFSGAEWMRDLGKRYEKRPMRFRRRLKPQHVKILRKWLLSHPEVKP